MFYHLSEFAKGIPEDVITSNKEPERTLYNGYYKVNEMERLVFPLRAYSQMPVDARPPLIRFMLFMRRVHKSSSGNEPSGRTPTRG